MVANVVQHKIEKEKQPSKYDNNFQYFIEKMARKMPQITLFPPLFLEEILTKTKCCMALFIKSNKYLLVITMILD
jgi:hypothetical protein